MSVQIDAPTIPPARLTATAGTVHALDTSQVKGIGLGAIVVILLAGLLVARLVTKLVLRVVVLVVVLALALLIYQQRDKVASATRSCHATFFGIHIQPHDPQIRKACQQVGSQLPK